MKSPVTTWAGFATARVFCSIQNSVAQNTTFYTSDQPLFHEGAVYHSATKSLLLTSDVIPDPSTANGTWQLISHVTGNLTSAATTQVTPLNATSHAIPFALGAYPYLKSTGLIVWVGQGSLTKPGAVFFLNPEPPFNVTQILSKYGDFEFNSPNDVAVTSSGEIYLTDPIYGSLYGFRPAPMLPNQVYRFNPATGAVRAVADGFYRPNGLTVNKDASTVYVIDTGTQPCDGTIDPQLPRTIYGFDVQGKSQNATGGFLGNRHLFSMLEIGGAKGVKIDTLGNVYVGLDDGVSVFDQCGDLLGKILIDGVANIGFGESGVLFAMGETKLWKIDLADAIIGVAQAI